MNGRSDFKIKINRQAIAEITSKTENIIRPQEIANFIREGAPYNDVRTVDALWALREYLRDRNCEPDFELVLNE